ncbi:nucleotide exchange factor GrpE [[Clostridium] colinum]|uniref:nucleotide exchange factor GrpE n=1 Tax=[Clostridium] colinum TaxID=36835 RepID=UPI0020256717
MEKDIEQNEITKQQDEDTQEQITEEIVEELSQNDLKDRLEKAEASSKEYLDKLQRSMAEFDNFRKRTNLEKASMYENGTRDAIEKLLPILDNFERAILSTTDEDKESAMFKGIDMIFNQMVETFKNMGIEEVAGVGESFDPNIHNAVLHIEDDTLGENVVAEVMQKGYKYKDKVIRPSMVKVAN